AALGTETPDEKAQPVSNAKIAAALISVFKAASEGKKVGPALAKHEITEIAKAAVSAASPEAKGAICFASGRADFLRVGVIQIANLLNTSVQAGRPHANVRAIFTDLQIKNREAFNDFIRESSK